MDNQVVLDSCQYDINDNGNCVLKGWFYLGGEKPEFQVRFGHEALPFELRFVPRPDVIAAFPGVTFPDENTGFELVLKNLTELFERQESLRIRVCGKEEKFPLLQKTAEELQTEYRQDTVKYFIEKTERHMENVYLQGWCIHSLGELTMTLENEKGEALEGAKWTSLRRADLAELFQKDLSACEGFGVEIPRKNVHGKELILVFDNGLAKKKEILDMKKFDQENSRRGKVRKLFQKENRKETLKILKENGVSGLHEYIQEESLGPEEYYNYYARRMAPGKRVLARQAMENFTETPLFSIVVPLYRTPLPYLKELIDSVVAQSYGNWQLCLADGSDNHQIQEFMKKNYSRDRRICYKLLEENTGISGNTNAALSMAVGDFIVFADHDDTLTPDALYENVKVLEANPEADFIYSDEDLTDEFGEAYDPHFKPDFNLDYLRSINYICHLVVVKRSLYEQVGKLNPEYDGAQDYDFVLRCVEKAKDIHHIPKVLYHWRSHSGSTAGNGDNKQYAIDAGRKALEAHYERLGMETEVTYTGLTIVYDTKYKVKGDPMVSVLIPNKDHVDDLDQCIR
ncbi:MAG: glycosyltransferase, partial [Eubacteriales bacterium]|nr:glycosyltransferase [Eubacteriales bacterium]